MIDELAVVEGQSLRAVMPSMLRALRTMAEAEAAAQNKNLKALFWKFGREHPLYDAIPELLPKSRPSYGWYIRVPDVPGFLRHIAPALEARLARSPLAGHSGELKINEYRGGFRIVLEKGKIVTVEPWKSMDSENRDAQAAFPPLMFLQLLFGYRALSELREFYADCWAQDEAHVLLDTLFPRQSSHVIPLS
jgi:hypothetical protein